MHAQTEKKDTQGFWDVIYVPTGSSVYANELGGWAYITGSALHSAHGLRSFSFAPLSQFYYDLQSALGEYFRCGAARSRRRRGKVCGAVWQVLGRAAARSAGKCVCGVLNMVDFAARAGGFTPPYSRGTCCRVRAAYSQRCARGPVSRYFFEI